MLEWSERQRGLLSSLIYGDSHHMVVSGPLQSGKSVAACSGFGDLAAQWSGRDILVCTRSQRQMTGSVLSYLRSWHEAVGLGWRRKEEWYEAEAWSGRGSNRFIPLLGTHVGSEGRARSFTAAAALIDEATLLPPEFVHMVLSRLSVPGARGVLVTNPDSPQHWIKKDMIDEGVEHHSFALSDNPSLTDEYIASLRALHHGAQARRMVDGEWATAEGLVYPFVRVEGVPSGEPTRLVVAADWAGSGWTHAVLIAEYGPDDWHVVSEWLHHGDTGGHLNELEQAEAIRDKLTLGRKVSMAVSDKSNPRFVSALGKVLECPSYPSYKGVKDEVKRGCLLVRAWMEDGLLTVGNRCSELVRQMMLYRWDERAAILGEDKPVKEDDHGCDALRYGVWAIAKARGRRQASATSL